MQPPIQQILNAKPLHRLRYVASLLGWNGLQMEWVPFSLERRAEWGIQQLGVVFYRTGDWQKFHLQINERASNSPLNFEVTIYAARYGIYHIGWQRFTLFEDDDQLRAEADRVRPWLDRRLWKQANWRREFKRDHPEFALTTGRSGEERSGKRESQSGSYG